MNRLVTEIEFHIKEMLAYSFETFSSLIFYIVIVLGVYWLAIEENSTGHMDYLFGYMMWVLCSGLFSAFIMNVKSDISNRTLELMETMPSSYLYALLMKSLARVPYDILVMTLLFIAMPLLFTFELGNFELYRKVLINFLIFSPLVISVSLICSAIVLAFKRAEIFILLGNTVVGILIYLVTKNVVQFPEFGMKLSIIIYLLVTVTSLSLSVVFFNSLKKWIIRTGRLIEV
jgi:hypothetical protein